MGSARPLTPPHPVRVPAASRLVRGRDVKARDSSPEAAAASRRLFAFPAGAAAAAARPAPASNREKGRRDGPGAVTPPTPEPTGLANPLVDLPATLDDAKGWQPSALEGVALLTVATALLLGLGAVMLRRRGGTGAAP